MSKQLPKNWIEVSLKEVTNNKKGKKPNIQSEVEFNGAVPYMDIKALEYNEIRQYADVESSKLFEEGDVAMVWDGARSGWVSKTNFGAIGSTLVAFHPILFNSNYLFYYLLEKYPFINSNARGVGIPHVDPTILWDLKFPLSPLSEQNRIVEKLDNLFNQLEIIKASMANIPLLLKDFRQQVLTQAVTGKLTVEWRKDRNLERWKFKTINEISDSLSGYAFKSADFVEHGIQLIRMGNLYNNKLDLNRNPVYLPFEYNNKILEKYSLKKNDILLSLTGTKYKRDYGFAIKIKNEEQLLLNQRILALRPKINVDYFLCLLRDNIFRDQFFSFETGGVNQGNVGTKSVLSIKLEIPSDEEQQEIVSRVNNLFTRIEAIEQQYITLKEKIDTLPQALLHKAFKGELSEQLDSDGDARVLLKEIETLKNSVKKPKKK